MRYVTPCGSPRVCNEWRGGAFYADVLPVEGMFLACGNSIKKGAFLLIAKRLGFQKVRRLDYGERQPRQ